MESGKRLVNRFPCVCKIRTAKCYLLAGVLRERHKVEQKGKETILDLTGSGITFGRPDRVSARSKSLSNS